MRLNLPVKGEGLILNEFDVSYSNLNYRDKAGSIYRTASLYSAPHPTSIYMQDKEPKWITFRLCRNNMHPSTSAILMNFKEIICKALPNMGRDHIVRLLMDPRH